MITRIKNYLKLGRGRGKHFYNSGASRQGTLSNWTRHTVPTAQSERDRRTVRDRARDLHKNDALAHGLLEALPGEIVNIGITPQPAPMTEFLGKTPEWEQEFQEKVFNYFTLWGLDPRNFCDATARQNIYMMQSLALFNWKCDGLAAFQIVMKEGPGRLFELCLLPIDVERIQTPTDADKSRDIYDGIEIDIYGAPQTIFVIDDTDKQAQSSNIRLQEKVARYD